MTGIYLAVCLWEEWEQYTIPPKKLQTNILATPKTTLWLQSYHYITTILLQTKYSTAIHLKTMVHLTSPQNKHQTRFFPVLPLEPVRPEITSQI